MINGANGKVALVARRNRGVPIPRDLMKLALS